MRFPHILAIAGLLLAASATAQDAPAPAPPAPETAPAEPAADSAPVQAPAATPAPAAAPRRMALVIPPPLDPENTWYLDLSNGGRVTIQLRPDGAPAHVERIKTLTRQGFYNGLAFHRVVEGFMAQGGDPDGTGQGGSSLPDVDAEFNNGLLHVRGAVGMARAQEVNSANSQFYIMFVTRLTMDRQYTVFGRVVSGMNFVEAIERGEPPLNPTRVVRASIGADNVPPMTAEQLQAEGARLAAQQRPPAGSLSNNGVVLVPAPAPDAAPRTPPR